MIARWAILGAGAWGTALAQVAASSGRRVRLWARDPALAAEITDRRTHGTALPGCLLHPGLAASADLAEALADAQAVLAVVPAQSLRAVLARIPDLDRPLVICAKGLERGTGHRLSQVAAETAPRAPVACLSGPNFAGEVAKGLPAAATIGCADERLGQALATALAGPAFRPYWTADLAGVEIGGAVKNVLAIAAGMVTGLELGDNARAALITRGLAEMTRLGTALGARAETFTGLSGLGDLVLPAGSLPSRNTRLGHRLARGEALGTGLTEGVATAAAVTALSARIGVETPIADGVHAVLSGARALPEVVSMLLDRPLKRET